MKHLFQRLLKNGASQSSSHGVITVVSGLPRSGTSMMMKMLEAGGLPVLTDNVREADPDNPKGYYEFERVKKLDKGDQEWLEEAQGKAVKIISELLKYLPPRYRYRVIFINRKMEEILASHRKMLKNRGVFEDEIPDEEMARLFNIHLKKVGDWLEAQPNISVLYVDYNELLAEPTPQLREINRFLGNKLDVEKMAEVVDPTLYRNRG
ncbi:MAG TPA: sulfotransferase domain-containing protein [Thermodesulfobacteriota bacterium]|nr:sulfotransferase domain-containing protein [Thermodesulfobacteriota bacterium]